MKTCFCYATGCLRFNVQPSDWWFPGWYTCEWDCSSLITLDATLLILELFLQVFEIAKTVGWVPDGADRQKTYLHLNRRIPEELKFDLNCLLYTHGKQCRKCGKRGNNKVKNGSDDVTCPLLKYCNGYRMKITDQRNQCTSVWLTLFNSTRYEIRFYFQIPCIEALVLPGLAFPYPASSPCLIQISKSIMDTTCITKAEFTGANLI